MKKREKHIARLLLCMALCPLLLLCSCINDNGPFADDDDPAERESCLLTLNVGLLETRAGDSGASLAAWERMRTLRVVVLSQTSGKVEFNRHYSLDAASESLYGPIVIPVKADGKKRIYLIANEEWAVKPTGDATSIADFLGSAVVGSSAAEFASDIADAVFAVPSSSYGEGRYIPMSSVYEVDTDAADAGKRKDCGTFYIVRTVTKFTFSFRNDRVSGEPVYVNSWEISGLAENKAYLMPHFTPNADGSWGYSQNRALGVWTPFGEGWTETGSEWKEWLVKVSDESNIDPENPTADENGWLTVYEIPSTQTETVIHKYDDGELVIPIDDKEHDGLVVTYRPESKTVKTSDYAFAGEQEYKVNLWVTERGEEHSFAVPVTIPNLRSLFRNTHVCINVRFGEKMNDDVIYAKIIDWVISKRIEGELRPE